MNDEQNARLDAARLQSGRLYHAGDIRGLWNLGRTLYVESIGAWNEREFGYYEALVSESVMIAESAKFLEAEYAATHGEAVTHG